MLTELELHEWQQGVFRTLTDVDVVAVARLPSHDGPAHYQGGVGTVECLFASEVDPALGVATDRSDVIIGEAKRGEVSFNAAVVDPRVLHAVLRRIGVAARTPFWKCSSTSWRVMDSRSRRRPTCGWWPSDGMDR